MGALHDAHMALVERALQRADTVVMSIFVNPLQFGPQEDFAKYPRAFERDAQLAEERGVDVIFAPDVDEMYPQGDAIVRIVPGRLGEHLCGPFRPGHFEGVLTVVAKLFNLVQPDVAVFGQKDLDRKSTRLNSSHSQISYAVFCLKNNNRSFFFNDTATTEIYTLSLHDALPI